MRTTRPMTSEEFAEQTRLSNKVEEGLDVDKAIEDAAKLTYGDEGNAGNGDSESSSESREDLTGVEADRSELMAAKEVYVPTM